MSTSWVTKPSGVCRNCFITWKASKPRDPILYCHHYHVLAHLQPDDSWEVADNASPDDAKLLRHSLARRQR